jgi:tRNA pseudouridine55 synthase
MAPDRDGLLLLDKPAGISSAAALNRVKRLTGAKKAGHAGTLDPFATGLLICCLGRATRLSRFFLESEKRYAATLRLGVETDTQDRTGAVTAERPVPPLDPERVRRTVAEFQGTRLQEPPAFSALKHEGVPLYRLARKGRPVRKPPREITIHRLAVVDVRPTEIDFEVRCSAGTYIRTLAVDIGRALGSGAHLSALRRTGSGQLDLGGAAPLEALERLAEEGRVAEAIRDAAGVLPLPTLRADAALARRIRHGNPLAPADLAGAAPGPNGHVQVLAPDGRLLAILRRAPDGGVGYACVLG